MRILVAAGPTVEPIDPVRFISNRSTGEMGLNIVREARSRGHKVRLILGPLPTQTMRAEVKRDFKWCNCLIMAAAVCDYRVNKIRKSKIKRSQSLTLKLIPNPDILKELGQKKGNKILIGFALESQNLRRNAIDKLKRKNLDIIVANKIGTGSTPFGNTKTDYMIIGKEGWVKTLRSATKKALAKALLDKIEVSQSSTT